MGLFNKLFSKSKSEKQEQKDEIKATSFVVRYEIAWKDEIEPQNRDFDKTECCNEVKFCKAIMDKNKVFSRSDIEKMTARLGYSVFDNIGGAVNDKGEPICSCKWKSVTLVKKD